MRLITPNFFHCCFLILFYDITQVFMTDINFFLPGISLLEVFIFQMVVVSIYSGLQRASLLSWGWAQPIGASAFIGKDSKKIVGWENMGHQRKPWFHVRIFGRLVKVDYLVKSTRNLREYSNQDLLFLFTWTSFLSLKWVYNFCLQAFIY